MNSLTKQIQELDHDIELMEAIEEVMEKNTTYRIENYRNKISKKYNEKMILITKAN